MSRFVRILRLERDRHEVIDLVRRAPWGTEIQFKRNRRSTEQNSRLWAMLSDVASQLTWHGVKLTTDDWKLVFLDALKRETRIVPNIDGNGFVNLGRSSSDLTKEEMSDLQEIIASFGAQHGVVFHDPNDKPAPVRSVEANAA